MTEEIKDLFTRGVWSHYQDDHLPPFFDAVGALEEEKLYLLKCHPQMEFAVDQQTITITTIPNPDKDPDVKAVVVFKLGEEFEFQAEGHILQVRAEWKDSKLIQHLTPKQSHTLPHTIELYIDSNQDLVQVYKVTDTNGQEVTGTRRFQKPDVKA